MPLATSDYVINKLKSQTFKFIVSSTTCWALVEMIKPIAHQLRPNAQDYKAFPSGHACWSSALLAACVLADNIEKFPAKQKMHIIGVTLNLLVAGGRILAKKHWPGNVVAGTYISISTARTIQNFAKLYTQSNQKLPLKTIDLVKTYENTLLLASLLVSNPPKASFFTILPLAALSHASAGLLRAKYAEQDESHPFFNGVLAQSPLQILDKKIRLDASSQEMMMMSIPLLITSFLIACNLLNKPFTMRRGTQSSTELALYDHDENDRLGLTAEISSWVFAILSALLGLLLAQTQDVINKKMLRSPLVITP